MIDYIKKAQEYALLSDDLNTKVGCVIVKDNKIVSYGFNCLPKGLTKEKYPLDKREGEYLKTKYPYMLHSEAMAIANAKSDLTDASIYVTLFPCNECAKLIIHSGINKVYYLEDKYAQSDGVIAAKLMFDDAQVKYILIEGGENGSY